MLVGDRRRGQALEKRYVLPTFLLPECEIQDDGAGPEIELGASEGKMLLLTLGITRIVEQESLDVSIWGSADGQDWGARPLFSFPQKFYCGAYQAVVDVSGREDIRKLRVQWKVNRWGRGSSKPLFGFYVFAEGIAHPKAAAETR